MIKLGELLKVIPMTTPIELVVSTENGLNVIKPSSFREELLSRLGVMNAKVDLMRLDKQDEETVLRICVYN